MAGQARGASAVVTTLLLIACSASPSATATVASESIAASPTAAITPSPTPAYQPARVIARIPLPHPDPQTPFDDQTAITADAIWVADARGDYLVRIDLITNRVTTTVPIQPSALQAGDGQLWSLSPVGVAPEPATTALSRVDLPTGIVHEVAQVQPFSSFAVGLGAVWVLGASLMKIDPTTGSKLATWPSTATDVFVGCEALWTLWYSESGSFMTRINTNSGIGALVGTLPLTLDSEPKMISTPNSCWLVSRYGVQALVAGELAAPVLPPCCGDLTAAGDSLWLTAANGEIGRVDPKTGAILERWALPPEDLFLDPKGHSDWRLLSAGGTLWLLTGAQVVRFDISTGLAPQ
jgi:hypothetical protein